MIESGCFRTVFALSLLASMLASCALLDPPKPPIDGPRRDRLHTDSVILAVEFAPDSQHIAHLDAEGNVHIWNVLLEKTAGKREFQDFRPESVAMGRNNRFAVAGSGTIRIYNVKSGLVAELRSNLPVLFMMFDAAAKHLAVAHRSGIVKVYDVAERRVVREYMPTLGRGDWRLIKGAGFGVTYLHDKGKIRILSCEPRGADLFVDFERSQDGPVSISKDGRFIALVNPQGVVEVRSLPNGDLVASLEGITPTPQAMDLSPDGSVLAVADRNRGVHLWDVRSVELLETFESEVWEQTGVAFSEDGNFLAWVERGRKTVRFWSPVRGVVQWTAKGPVLRPDARGVCHDLASIVRFRLAAVPFKEGAEQLSGRELEQALQSFAAARKILATYPGLAEAEAEAKERYAAKLLGPRLEGIENGGKFKLALGLMEAFLRDRARFDDYGFTKRADTLRKMLRHFDLAEAHKAGGRKVDAVIEFEAAVAIVRQLRRLHPEYVRLRHSLVASLAANSEAAHAAEDFNRVIELYEQLRRLQPLVDESLLRLGYAHERLKYDRKAVEVFQQVSRSSKKYGAAQRSIARLARASDDPRKARRHLEMALEADSKNPALEVEYAEVCLLCEDPDAAVRAWIRVGKLQPGNPRPYEVIASIEREREQWPKVAEALRIAVTRSSASRPKLLIAIAAAHRKAKRTDEVLRVYQELIGLIDRDPAAVVYLGKIPRQKVENWIRKLGFVRHRKEWIPREQFLEIQGWERRDGIWLRPDEARLHEIARRYESVSKNSLRAFSDERYKTYADEHRITKGMNRREVISAWGFFDEQNAFIGTDGKAVFEQLLFTRSRKVFLKNGLVCHWSE